MAGGRTPNSHEMKYIGQGKAMRPLLCARPRRMIRAARSAVISRGMGNGLLSVMRLTTKPGQITLTAMPSSL